MLKSNWIRALGVALASALASASLYLAFVGAPANVKVDPAQISVNERNAYTLGVKNAVFPFDIASDGGPAGYIASVVLTENGRPLGPAHALHDEIRHIGQGRFSYWDHTIYFATSDNTDPRTNGRAYVLQRSAKLSPGVAILGVLPLAILLAFGFRDQNSNLRKGWRGVGEFVDARLAGRLFWAASGLVLLIALAIRVFWTATLQTPFISPDTASYVWAAMENPALPFGEQRTPGFPLAISIAAIVFHHPIGLLITANIAWLAATAALTFALAQWTRLRAVAFAMLVYLCFSPKDLTFEYYLMSEHYSRVMFMLYVAAALLVAQRPASLRRAGVLAAVTAASLLVKPTAMVCFVSTLLLYGYCWWRRATERGAIVRHAALVSAVAAATLVLFMLAFDLRFGQFALTNFSGTNQFSHSGHLIDYASPRNAELKARLRPIMERYTREYVAKGDFQPNWLIYGSTTDKLRADFGEVSPRSIIEEYLRDHGTIPDTYSMDRAYGAIASEGLKAHLPEYLSFALNRAEAFMRQGYSFKYSLFRPSALDFADHARQAQETRAMLYVKWNTPPPPCSASPPPPPQTFFVARFLLSGPLSPCGKAAGADPEDVTRAHIVDQWFQMVAGAIEPIFAILPRIAWFFPLVLLAPAARTGAAMRALEVAAFAGVLSLGYIALHGLINTAEPPRLFAPIQDVVVLMFLAAIASGVAGAWAIVTRTRQGWQS